MRGTLSNPSAIIDIAVRASVLAFGMRYVTRRGPLRIVQ